MTSTDWMKTTRQGIVDHYQKVLDWLMKDSTDKDGKKVTNWARIGVTPDEFQEFATLGSAVKNILAVAKDESRNTKVVTREAEAAFNAFIACFRTMRALHLNGKKLTPAEQVECGFTPRDGKPTPKNNPTAAIFIRTALGDNRGELKIFVEAESGDDSDLDERDNQGWYFIKTLILPAGSPPPTHHSQLTGEHKMTRRRKGDKIVCGTDHSGDDLYLCARIEEGDRAGEYGPIIKVKIP